MVIPSINDRESRKEMGQRKEGQAGAEDPDLITLAPAILFTQTLQD